MKGRIIKISICTISVVITFCLLLFKDVIHISSDNPPVSKNEFIHTYCASPAIQENLLELIEKEVAIEKIDFLSGNQVTLNNKSKYILEVMSINCNHCNESMKPVLDFKKESKIPIYTCCFADDPIAINEWMMKNKYDFDMGMLDYDTVKYDIGIKYTPCFLFVEDGIIQMAYTGNIKDKEFMKELILTAYF